MNLTPPVISNKWYDHEDLSRHNRIKALRRLGSKVIPAIHRELTDEQAKMVVATTNLEQRETLFPSERAFAYRLMMCTFNKRVQGSNANDSGDSEQDEKENHTGFAEQ